MTSETRCADHPKAQPGGAPAAPTGGGGILSVFMRRKRPAAAAPIQPATPRNAAGRIGVLVVHGIGEQTRFEQLETVASNFFLALEWAGRSPRLDVIHGAETPRHSPEHSWNETPIVIRWRGGEGELREARFHEVHWADLDTEDSFTNWFAFVIWALGMPAVRIYAASQKGLMSMPAMESPPRAPGEAERWWVRIELCGVSLLFFLMLISLDLVYFLARRLSFQARWLAGLRAVLYDYLGDIKLYQDRFRRHDACIEALGQKSRIAIRRRMVQGLVKMAMEVESGRLDGYYVVAHSLGTVVAFNGLMVPEELLPNFLSLEEWRSLPARFKKVGAAGHDCCDPPRPPWLVPTDAIDRDALFSGLKGFMTLGSPLDKFAALWPAIVPVNKEPIAREIPWVNVADAQDIVAGTLEAFSPAESDLVAGAFRLQNCPWGDQRSLFTAHTSYWSARADSRERVIDRLIGWIEQGRFIAPKDAMNPDLAALVFRVTLPALGLFSLWIVGSLLWMLGPGSDDVGRLFDDLTGGDVGAVFSGLCGVLVSGEYWGSVLTNGLGTLLIGTAVVGVVSAYNWFKERRTYSPPG
jgi:hypothetical protein